MPRQRETKLTRNNAEVRSRMTMALDGRKGEELSEECSLARSLPLLITDNALSAMEDSYSLDLIVRRRRG